MRVRFLWRDSAMTEDLRRLFTAFLQTYDLDKKNAIWTAQSQRFRAFWSERIMGQGGNLEDADIDEIVRILDRHGKGNTKESEAIARVMIPQGAWRRLFNEVRATKSLATALNDVFIDSEANKRAGAINRLYS